MKKSDAEAGIRRLCWEYAKLNSIPMDGSVEPSFGEFHGWVRDNYPAYLGFQTTGSKAEEVERWWAQEFKQTWRY